MYRNGVTVVIATYNEAETIRQILGGLRDYQVVLVDDSSPDGTGNIAMEYENVRVISRSGKLGIRSAYVTGFKFALANYPSDLIVQMDAGMTHDPHDVGRLVEQIDSADLVIGSRFVVAPHVKGIRTIISLVAAFLMSLLGVHVSDATSGFRCWRARLLSHILSNYPPEADGFAFQLEMLYHAWQVRRVVEVPIYYRLTNSSFNWRMLVEAMRVYMRLASKMVRCER